MKYSLSIFLSILPSIHLSGRFLGIVLFVLSFGMVLETHMKLCVTELDFPENIFFVPNIGKMT